MNRWRMTTAPGCWRRSQAANWWPGSVKKPEYNCVSVSPWNFTVRGLIEETLKPERVLGAQRTDADSEGNDGGGMLLARRPRRRGKLLSAQNSTGGGSVVGISGETAEYGAFFDDFGDLRRNGGGAVAGPVRIGDAYHHNSVQEIGIVDPEILLD